MGSKSSAGASTYRKKKPRGDTTKKRVLTCGFPAADLRRFPGCLGLRCLLLRCAERPVVELVGRTALYCVVWCWIRANRPGIARGGLRGSAVNGLLDAEIARERRSPQRKGAERLRKSREKRRET